MCGGVTSEPASVTEMQMTLDSEEQSAFHLSYAKRQSGHFLLTEIDLEGELRKTIKHIEEVLIPLSLGYFICKRGGLIFTPKAHGPELNRG